MKTENRALLKKNILKFFILHSLFFILVACGYKPVSHYTRQTIASPLYLQVVLSKKEPDSGLVLTDTLRTAIRYRLKIPTTSSVDTAASRLKVHYDKISYTALAYDENGYVERYRVNMVTTFLLQTEKGITRREIHTTHEADVTPSALASSRAKEEAIKACSLKAVDQFVAYLASVSVKNKYAQ